jgi:carbon monoxide dehydrogenase subunit G
VKFHLDGKTAVNASLEKTYASLCDPHFMVGIMPDVESSRILGQNNFEAKIKVGISIVRGTVDMQFSLVDKVEKKHTKLVGEGSGAGSRMRIESSFDLSSDGGQVIAAPTQSGGESTIVSWSADADLSGLISGIGGSMLKSQSEKMVSQIVRNIKTKLEKG